MSIRLDFRIPTDCGVGAGPFLLDEVECQTVSYSDTIGRYPDSRLRKL